MQPAQSRYDWGLLDGAALGEGKARDTGLSVRSERESHYCASCGAPLCVRGIYAKVSRLPRGSNAPVWHGRDLAGLQPKAAHAEIDLTPGIRPQWNTKRWPNFRIAGGPEALFERGVMESWPARNAGTAP
jgi:hypothetical protein